jgi:hypothetical protein
LRYVLGEVDWSELDRAPEKHVRCDSALAQFIVCESFQPVVVLGMFAKKGLDPEYVRTEEARVTRGFLRLREVVAAGVPIADYPLSRAVARSDPGLVPHDS